MANPSRSPAKELVKNAPKKAFYDTIDAPMLATLVDKPFDQQGWIYEIKWDGYRAVAFMNKNVLELKSRNNKSFNEAENGAKSTMTSILGRMATYSGQEIKWDDAINSQIALRPAGYTFDSRPPTVPNAEGWYPIAIPGKTKTV